MAQRSNWLTIILWVLLFYSACTIASRHTGYNTAGATKTNASSIRSEVVAFAKKHIGAKYKYAGRTPKGFDCSGFTCYVMKEVGVDLTPISREQEGEGRKIEVNAVKPGDLLFFRRKKNASVFHVALVVSNDRNGISMIHSTNTRGVVIDNLQNNSYWKSKIVTARSVLD